jgi:hypothetical protein
MLILEEGDKFVCPFNESEGETVLSNGLKSTV